MAKLGRYRTTPPTPARLLHHVLENPAFVRAVRELPAAVLGKLIDATGLESAGEIVALATTAQLESVFDEDLWKADAVGDDPAFDPARFGVWLEILLEAGEAAVVERLCELPFDFVVLAVQRLVLVVDMDRLGEELPEEEELDQMEKALDASLCEEWEEFRLIARDHSAWDAVLTALLALDREHHGLLRRILERCWAASSEYIDDNGGLYAVLTSEELLEADARAERDDRRGARGYVAPSDARSFLALAREGLGNETERDPVTRAYFRELDRTREPTARAAATRPSAARGVAARPRATRDASTRGASTSAPKTRASKPSPEASPDVAELVALIERAGGTAEAALLQTKPETLLGLALAELNAANPAAYAERMEELGFLANVLVAGEPHAGRRFRPIEALETAVEVASAALEKRLEAARGPSRVTQAAELLAGLELDRLFRAGWHARHAGRARD